MARGWIAGLLTGVVVSGLGLATVSMVMGPVAPVAPQGAVEAVDEPRDEMPADAPEETGAQAVVEATEPPAAPVPDTEEESEPAREMAGSDAEGMSPATQAESATQDAETADPAMPDAEPPADAGAEPDETATERSDAMASDAASSDEEPASEPEAAPAPAAVEPTPEPAPVTVEPDPETGAAEPEAMDETAPGTGGEPTAEAEAEDTTETAATEMPRVAEVDVADEEPHDTPAPTPKPEPEQVAPPVEEEIAAPAPEAREPVTAPVVAAPEVETETAEPAQEVAALAPPSSEPAPEPVAEPEAPEETVPAEELVPALPSLQEPATEPSAPAQDPPAAPQARQPLPQMVAEPEPAVEPEEAPEIALVSPSDLPPELEADPAASVVTDRLPRIGDAPVAPEAGAPAAVTIPALSRNAAAFAPSGDQPRLAFLLLDTGAEDRAGLGDLGNLPFPVTVAVDASAVDAEQAIAFYRGQGAEVVLIVPLPEGATPTDVDVTIEAYGPLLDRAAAVMVEEGLGFQTLGAGAVQLATNLAESGHGLVSYPAGLNTGHKAAVKEGVKAGLVFRDLDGAGQEGPVIRRFLDNAAFRARNEEGVIVVARTRAETVQALLEWSLGNRAQSVALAPVSAILAGE